MFTAESDKACPVVPLTESGLKAWLEQATAEHRKWVDVGGFKARSGTSLMVPDEAGGVACVLAGHGEEERVWALAHLPSALPSGRYRLEADWSGEELQRARLGWALGHYRYDRYKPAERRTCTFVVPGDDAAGIGILCDAIFRVRDLVNMPANSLGPTELADVAAELAERRDAKFSVIDGERLEREFPAIHVVGRASSRAPRLIRFEWGDPAHPPLALVGKGVVFDTGGLDIKPGSGMALMKKDMGGAAHVLGLAEIIMRRELPVHLRVYIPAVENAIAGDAYRPSDIITTRSGVTVEIGNTDAEGRVVLSDALTLASEEGAARIVDFATLTGAARVALGEDLPALYGRDQAASRAVQDLAFEIEDPVWHMPLYRPYKTSIQPPVAELSNSGTNRFAGSITAALFLDHFVRPGIDWHHLDIYAWNLTDRPGRPSGGEAQGLRAVWAWLQREYGQASA